MAIIKTIHGAELYKAETARGVLAALTEAVARGADLRGAYLRGAYLRGAYLRGADLQGAYLQGADLQGADLQGAYLQGAYLQGAYLRGAYLRGADLQGAYLQGAHLQGADLQGASGVNRYLSTPLLMLHDQPGEIVAYKLVNGHGTGPHHGGLKYEVGKTVRVLKKDANQDEASQCGAGINVATLDWCMREWEQGYRILRVLFTARDIAVIPTATDGKFRCFKVRVVSEVDLVEIGLIEP